MTGKVEDLIIQAVEIDGGAMDISYDQTVEIKARCTGGHGLLREALLSHGAAFAGEFEQSDTFYNVRDGRLKLRRSTAGSLLIAYRRPDQTGPKNALVDLHPTDDPDSLDRALASVLGVRLVVEKTRALYTLDNIRFHLDRVKGLGDFVEIEVMGKRGMDSIENLHSTCRKWLEILGIKEAALVDRAYADLLESGGFS